MPKFLKKNKKNIVQRTRGNYRECDRMNLSISESRRACVAGGKTLTDRNTHNITMEITAGSDKNSNIFAYSSVCAVRILLNI